MKRLLSMTLALTMMMGLMSITLSDNSKEVTAGRWERLGIRKVNMRADHDEIPVTITEGFFTKVKFKVLKAPIYVKNVRVVFGNGESKNVNVDRKFAPGDESKVLDLPGNKRVIKKININYTTVPAHRSRAVVTVWGKH